MLSLKAFLAFAIVVCLMLTNVNYTYALSQRRQTIENIGTYLQYLLPLSGLACTAAIQDWEGSFQWAKAGAGTLIVTQGLKETIPEARPNEPKGTRGMSFPSGHTSSAFFGAGFWQMRYGWYVGAPMYLLAAFTGYSRVQAYKHWWWDVVAGAAIGIGFNYVFVTKYQKAVITVSAAPMYDGAQISLNARF